MSRTMLGQNAMKRRSLVKSLAAVAAAAALPASRSRGAELPHLDVKDSAAVPLGYVEQASQVDAKKYPAFVKGSRCDNCLLLQGTSGAYRPCSLFPGKLVSASGWCSGWSAEI
jgi:hypothetical protein